MKKPLFLFLGICTLLLTAINISLSAMMADAGDKLADLSKQATTYEQEIQTLKLHSIEAVALTDLKTTASQLGYTETVDYTEVGSPKPLAYARN